MPDAAQVEVGRVSPAPAGTVSPAPARVGYDLVAVDPLYGRVGIARDSSTGEYVLWAVEEDEYWPDRNGAPVPVDPALLKDGSLEPGNVATVLSTMVELDALADMPLEAAGGMRAVAETLLNDAKNPRHPLHPFRALLEQAWPEIWRHAYSGAFWSHRPNGRKASDLASHVVSVLGGTLNDPLTSKSTSKDLGSTSNKRTPTGGVAVRGAVGKEHVAALGRENRLAGETAAASEGIAADAEALSGLSLSLHSLRPQGDGSFVVWDDIGDRPAVGAEGGTLTGRVTDDSGRFAVVTDSLTGTIAIFDLRRGQLVADPDGVLVAAPAGRGRLTIDHDTDFAHRLAANVVALGVSRTIQERSAAIASLEVMLREMNEESHLFDLFSEPVRQFIGSHNHLHEPPAAGASNKARGEEALRLATGLATPFLHPDFIERYAERQLWRGTMDLDTLRGRFTSVTGYALVEGDGGSGAVIVQDATGASVMRITPTQAESLVADPRGAQKLDVLAAWQSGEIGATEAALALLQALQGAGDEEAAAELGDAIFALEEAIAEGRIDRSQAATLLIPALYPDAELPVEFVEELVLDTLPIIGNIRSAEAFVEDIEAVGLAIENDDWWAASGNALLAVLDLASVFPGVGFILRPIKNAFLRVARRSGAFRRVHAGVQVLWMERQGRRPGFPTRVEDYFAGVWPHLTSRQQASLRGLYPRMIGDAGEQHLNNLLGDLNYNVMRRGNADDLTAPESPTAVTQALIRRRTTESGETIGGRRPDVLINRAGSLMQIVFGRGRRADSEFGQILEMKVNASDISRQQNIDDALRENGLIDGAFYLRMRLRDLDPQLVVAEAERFLSRPKYSSFTEAQRSMIIDDITRFYKNGSVDFLLFDFFIGLELRAMASLQEDVSAFEPAD